MLVGHGQTLKRLHLKPRQAYRQFLLGLEECQKIMDCQQIEELSIKVRRSLGDDREIALYKTLGALPSLQTLWILLDASNRALGTDYPDEEYESDDARYEEQVPNDSRFDEEDKKMLPGIHLPNGMGIRKGFIRDAFVNMALDENLARSIFTTISTGKPPGAIALERMQICAADAFVFTNHSISYLEGFAGLAMLMRQPWLVERNPRDDCRDELIVRNLKREEEYHSWDKPSKVVEEWFKSVWPDDGTTNEGQAGWLYWASK
jgi:hypothetical protein